LGPTTLGKLPKGANFLIDNATRRNIAAEHSNLALKNENALSGYR